MLAAVFAAALAAVSSEAKDRRAPARPPDDPLETRVDLRLKKVPLPAFLDELSQQAPVRFLAAAGLDDCRVTAFFRGATVREALMATQELWGVAFHRSGDSPLFAFEATSRRPCPRFEPPKKAKGSCRAVEGAKPISIRCEDAPMSDFAEVVSDQTSASFFFAYGTEDFPVSLRLKGARIKTALSAAGRKASLSVKPTGSSPVYVVTMGDKAK